MVLADIGSLASLPVRELRAGYAEIIKAGLIGDPELFAWCERHGASVIGGDAGDQAEAVERATAFKAAVVIEDEREECAEGGRALLNLGHTFGHAVEAEFGFDGRVLHGEAVALGCHLAFALSVRLGHCARADWERVRAHLRQTSLPASIEDLPMRLSADRLLLHMRRDKKMTGGVVRFVLTRGIGSAFTSPAPVEDVRCVLLDAGCDP